jgi:hypothetical protein
MDHDKALKMLKEIWEETREENWDGYGASPVSVLAFLNARAFLSNLPTTVPIPEITVEPDGEIAFEWYLQPRWVFSVSVGSNNELTYAGLFGRNKIHGTEYFENELPNFKG